MKKLTFYFYPDDKNVSIKELFTTTKEPQKALEDYIYDYLYTNEIETLEEVFEYSTGYITADGYNVSFEVSIHPNCDGILPKMFSFRDLNANY